VIESFATADEPEFKFSIPDQDSRIDAHRMSMPAYAGFPSSVQDR